MSVIKKTTFLIICLLLSFTISAQSFIGAWEGIQITGNRQKIKAVVLFSEGYQVIARYDALTGKFISTNGGTWQLNGNTMTEKIEFDTNDTSRVGTTISFKIHINDSVMGIVGRDMVMRRIDNGLPGKLQGAWLMEGRVRNGETQLRDITAPRKSMKILSGTRFQWIAYNTATKQFSGTGGGTYTTINGEYTENIEFFSRDNTKAGLSLKFNYSLIDGRWNHTGSSSAGEPLHEIWTVRQ